MLFNSWQFMIFLPVVFILYWGIPYKYRWLVVLLASYYFYMSWNVKYIVLIVFTTFTSYLSAVIIEKSDDDKKRKLYLIAAVVVSLSVLIVFKYFNFFSKSLADFLGLFALKLSPAMLNIVLPVGISFYTFQTLSYVIDVYKGKVEAEHHFGKYAAFISFFPQLVAGPIERTDNLLPQIKNEQEFSYEKAVYGLKLMAWGFFKKMVVADTLAVGVDSIYDKVHAYTGGALVVATVLFAVQIYCDFSGYSDIAIGCAKLFGIDLMTNFKTPYFSSSIKEFWERWHISLSTWFRDYVYIPLGGNRVSKFRRCINLLITFLVSGLWHGANYTYIVWGGIHGIYQIVENGLFHNNIKETRGVGRGLRIFIVFSLTCFAWIFFRAQNISDAIYVITHMFDGIMHPGQYVWNSIVSFISFAYVNRSFFVLAPILLIVYDYFSLKKDCIQSISDLPVIARWVIYLSIVVIVIFYTPTGTNNAFIYFQF